MELRDLLFAFKNLRCHPEYAANRRRALRENEERQSRELQAAIRQAEESKAARARVLEKLTRQAKLIRRELLADRNPGKRLVSIGRLVGSERFNWNREQR